jgi:hypothetical protein
MLEGSKQLKHDIKQQQAHHHITQQLCHKTPEFEMSVHDCIHLFIAASDFGIYVYVCFSAVS